jgi:hypothetical protein
MALPLVCTDELLFSSELGYAKRALLAATLGHPNHSPSLSLLADTLGIHKAAVRQAQRELQAEGAELRAYSPRLRRELILYTQAGATYAEGMEVQGWTHTPTAVPLYGDDRFNTQAVIEGQTVPVVAELTARPLAQYDRPTGAHDRHADNPRYKRTNRLVRIHPGFDPHHPGNAGRVTEVPAAVAEKIRNGRGVSNRPFALLVLAYYVREQLRRGAIHVPDEVVAFELRYGYDDVTREARTRQVRRIRERLIRDGILAASGDGIHVAPEGTPGKPPVPEALDKQRSRSFHPLVIGDQEWSILGSQPELAEAARLARRLGDEQAANALRQASLYSDDHEPAGAVIDALRAALNQAVSEAPCQMKPPSRPNEAPISTKSSPGVLPPTSPTSTSSTSEAELPRLTSLPGADDDDETDTQGGTPSSDSPTRSEPQAPETPALREGPGRASRRQRKKREYPDRYQTYIHANDEEGAELEKLHSALTAKYGEGEALFYWRQFVYEARAAHRSQAPGILALYRQRFGYPGDEVTEEAEDLLNSLHAFGTADDQPRDAEVAAQPRAAEPDERPAELLRTFDADALEEGRDYYLDWPPGSELPDE